MSSDATNPTTLRWAARLLGAYAVVVLVNATAVQSANGWQDLDAYPRALVRTAGVAFVIWGLLKRRTWAWWLAVVLSSVLLLVGAVTTLGLVLSDVVEWPWLRVVLGLSFALLALALGLLLQPGTRAAFRTEGAPPTGTPGR